MTNSNVIYLAPIKAGDTNVYWVDQSPFQVDSKLEYIGGMAFLDRKMLLIFLPLDNRQSLFVGRAFDYDGKVIFDVPFPEMEFKDHGIRISYGWSSATDNGVKIVFGTNSVYYGDFWGDFDFERKKYIATGRAY
jgi:hypothetical protein